MNIAHTKQSNATAASNMSKTCTGRDLRRPAWMDGSDDISAGDEVKSDGVTIGCDDDATDCTAGASVPDGVVFDMTFPNDFTNGKKNFAAQIPHMRAQRVLFHYRTNGARNKANYCLQKKGAPT